MLKMLKKILLVCVTFGISLSNALAQSSFEQECEKNLQLQVVGVSVSSYEANVNTSLTIKELTAIKQGVYVVPGVDYSKSHSLGLTSSESLFDIQYGVSKLTKGSKECFSPKFEVYLKLKPQTMYIASDLQKDSCLFKEVTEHEYKHSQLNQLALEKLKEELTFWVRQYIPKKIYYENSTVWLTNLRSDISSKILPYIKSRHANLTTELAATLDNPTEYARLSSVCASKDGLH